MSSLQRVTIAIAIICISIFIALYIFTKSSSLDLPPAPSITPIPSSINPTSITPAGKSMDCEYQGKRYKPGESVKIDACNSCSCDAGQIACTEMACL